MVRCVSGQLKHSELYIPSCEKDLGLSAFSTAKNVELIGLYPIRSNYDKSS